MIRLRAHFLLAAGLLSGCAPPPEQAAAPPDSAAIHQALDALARQFEAAETSGDPAAIAALFTDDATVEFYGAPTARGRAAIEQVYRAAPARTTAMQIEIQGVHAAEADFASAIGVVHQETDSAGTRRDSWSRWAALFRRPAGEWRLSYLMAFPDSVKPR